MWLSCINYRSQTVRSVSNSRLIVVSIEAPCRRADFLLCWKSRWEKSYFDQIEAPRASIFMLSCFFTTKVIDAG